MDRLSIRSFSSKWISLRYKILLPLVGILVGLVLLELILRGIGFFYSYQQERANQQALSKKGYKILALGESTTRNGGSNSWPSQLEQILNRQYPNKFSVINEGQAGTNSYEILYNLNKYLDKYKPDMVITMMGINDLMGGSRVYDERFGINVARGINNSSWDNRLSNLRVYKLLKLLWVSHFGGFNGVIGFLPTNPAYAAEHLDVAGELKLANDYYNQNNFLEAIRIYKEVIGKYPDLETAYRMLSESYASLGIHDDEFNVCMKAIQLFPNGYWAYACVADGYAYKDKTDLAEEYYKKGLQLDPNKIGWYENLSKFYLNIYAYTKAEPVLVQLLKIKPEDEIGLINLAEVYRCTNRAQQALPLANKAVAINPQSNPAYFELSSVYRTLGMESQGDEVTGKVLGLSSSLVSNYRELKDTLSKRGIKFVAVQYPVRSVNTLKQILGDDNVVYVDNESSFKQALSKSSYNDYFTDRFGGDFGHATPKGNYLLASNIAKLVLSRFFGTNN